MGHEFKFQVVPIAEAVETAVPATPRPLTVMVVDDEPLIVDSLAAILATTGLSVLKAYGGGAALELALSNPPDLLVTDVAMPGMNGIELAMAVADALPDCKVLLFSAHASTLDLRPAHAAGFDFPLLSKPIHPREMLKHVSATLQAAPSAVPTRTYPGGARTSFWRLSQANG